MYSYNTYVYTHEIHIYVSNTYLLYMHTYETHTHLFSRNEWIILLAELQCHVKILLKIFTICQTRCIQQKMG